MGKLAARRRWLLIRPTSCDFRFPQALRGKLAAYNIQVMAMAPQPADTDMVLRIKVVSMGNLTTPQNGSGTRQLRLLESLKFWWDGKVI